MRKLTRLRRNSGLTQYQLAAATGISRAKISQAELGIRRFTDEEMNVIRKVLVERIRKNAAVLHDLDAEPVKAERLRSER